MIVGVVCARRGSKGMPEKNMRCMLGTPLMYRAINKALACPAIDMVAVNTDIDMPNPPTGVMYVTRRPEDATAGASKWTVWQDTLMQLEENDDTTTIDAIVDIDVTRPLTTVSDLTHIIEFWKTHQHLDMVMAVAIAPKNPYFDILEYDQDGRLCLSKETPIVCRQDAPPAYLHAGAYVISRRGLTQHEALYDAKPVGVIFPDDRAYDIDTPLEWEIVETLMKKQQAPELVDAR